MDATESFGQRLRDRRSALGLTLLAVAIRAGVSVPYVANLEKGRGNPTLDVIVALADALEVPVISLVGTDPAPRGTESQEEALPQALLDYARGDLFQGTTQRLAELAQRPEEEMRRAVVEWMLAVPLPPGRELSRQDCRRVLDAFVLVLGDTD
jgi:transcriptional regulator with XRE-family HTH domain